MGEQKYYSTIRFKGTFNWHGLYEKFHSALTDREYEVEEKKFKTANSDFGGYDIEVGIVAKKKHDIDFMFKIEYTIKAYMLNKEATHPDNDGTTFGALEIFTEAETEYDYSKRWGEGLNKHIGKLYKFVKNPKDKTLRKEAQEIEAEIKKFLNMKLDNS